LEGQVSSAASENSKSSTIIKSLREEIDEMKLNNEKNHLLERVQLLNSENLAVKKSLAEYKDGYGKLSEQCKGLTEELKKNKEMVEHLKSFRRKSKISLTACPTIEEGNTEPMASTAGDLTVKNDRCDQQGTGDHATGKRRNSSRMSIRRKSTAPSNPSSRDHSTENVSASQFTCTEEKGESLTRIQLRRLRTGSVVHPDFSPQSKLTEEKECQVNIDSSKYANVRMGNEEEVVVKALYRRIAELESLSQSQQSEIEQLNLEKSGDDVLAKRKRVPATQLPCTEQDLSDYQMQSFETFLSLKADGVNLRLNVDELKNKLRSLEEYCATLQASPSLLECKATQCDSENFVANASIQASVLAKDYSTQTSQPTPLSNNQYIEDSFYSYIFKELLDVCKHVVATNRPSGSALGGEEGILSQTLSSCKNLISSLVVLRKDLFEEMQYRYIRYNRCMCMCISLTLLPHIKVFSFYISCRGGEFNTVRSRSFLRCIEVVIRAFDKIINCQ
jgi:predicted  nucleic acid-binding Zn-ribbon protein